jgi:hypothetical protein
MELKIRGTDDRIYHREHRAQSGASPSFYTIDWTFSAGLARIHGLGWLGAEFSFGDPTFEHFSDAKQTDRSSPERHFGDVPGR